MQNVSFLRRADTRMTPMPDTLLRDLAVLRRHSMSALAVIERIFRELKPICRKCFYDQGLLNECRCSNHGIRLTIRS